MNEIDYDAMLEQWVARANELQQEIADLKAENARLREALDLAYAAIDRADRCRAKTEGGG